ncbi:MAG: hypothetical protein GOVbin1709_14 [Prokaryotic dsDNA virus sp.]|nr:MAG: hypothetical protein GOVbin1709_14 [Prokaryotic dsDNA virus sp.]|tara:strand:+ start:10406 stop:11323 length:918 start_codon:yes stop_codon:yes gene_type:complete
MMSKRTLVYVKPIIRNKWHGLNDLNRSKFQDTADVLMALYDSKIGKLATGLDSDDETRLGAALGADLGSTSEYWDNFRVRLKDQTMIYDLSIPLQEVQIKLLKASRFVANSQKEFDQGKWPAAKYIIFDEEQELEKKATEVELKTKAIELFNNLSLEKKIDLLKIYGKYTMDSSRDFVYTKLYEIVEETPTDFLKVASLKPEQIKIKALVFDLERTGIFRRKGTAFLYNDQQVGFDYDNTVENLLDPMKQELLVKLKGDLEARIPSHTIAVKEEVIEEVTNVESEVKESKPKATAKKVKKDKKTK